MSNSQPVPVTVLGGRKTVTMIPSKNLNHNTRYRIHVSTQVQSITQNSLEQNKTWEFKTVSAPDKTPPRIVSVFPAPDAHKIETQSSIQIRFSERLNPSSINTSTLLLNDEKGEPVSGQLKYEDLTITFTPDQKLQLKSLYTFSVMKGIRDEADNALRQSKTWSFSTTSLDENMILVAPGSFNMGEVNKVMPQHRVTLTKEFYIGRQEVSAAEYEQCVLSGGCKYNLGSRKHSTFGVSGKEQHPINYVSWSDANDYVRWLSRDASINYRLCTEAEWEYAARAGSETSYFCGNSWSCVNESAWHSLNTPQRGKRAGTQAVKSKSPNEWGLYDMFGNVMEWVADRYGNYPSQAVTDPKGALSGTLRVLRGGGYRNPPKVLYSARRGSVPPDQRKSYIGFRVCANP